MTKPFENQNILLGITGSIAAYKAAELVRLFQKAGANVRVMMTESAQKFVTPLTFQALTGHPVASAMFDTVSRNAMDHIEYAKWAHRIVIAPASAQTIARLSLGLADDLLSAISLASEAPLYVAPAMNKNMWMHFATQENIARLEKRGVYILGPGQGYQACGDMGDGRMIEPEEIFSTVSLLDVPRNLMGVRAVVTAGPTVEAIDPVRYISNHSSGKMGYAVARALRLAGAHVTLISGPTSLETPFGITRISVVSAKQMLQAVLEHIEETDLFISVAAVADYYSQDIAGQKINKNGQALTLNLMPNPDIAATIGHRNDKRPFCVGFVAETHDLILRAQQKLEIKNMDMVAANWVGQEKGFGVEDNALTLVWRGGQIDFPVCSKFRLAGLFIEEVAKHYHETRRVKNN